MKNGNNNEGSNLATLAELEINRLNTNLLNNQNMQYVLNNINSYAYEYRQVLRAAGINVTENDIANLVQIALTRLGHNIDINEIRSRI